MRAIASILLALAAVLVCEAKMRSSLVRMGKYPGISVRVYKEGIDGICDGISEVAEAYAQRIPFPNATGELSNVKVSCHQFRVKRFVKPVITYVLQPPNTVTLKVVLPNVVIGGPIDATRSVFGFQQTDSGDIEMTLNDIAMNVTVKIGAFPNGVPMVSDIQCTPELGKCGMNLKGHKKEFTKNLATQAASLIRPGYYSQVCPMFQGLIKKNLNKFLSQLTDELVISKDLSLKWRVAFKVADGYVQADLFEKCITNYANQQSPVKFTENVVGTPMMAVWISDAVFTDILFQAYRNNLLNFTISNSSLPTLYKFISLDCGDEGICLGNVARRLGEKYGKDAAVEVHFEAHEEPSVKFEDGKATMCGNFSAALHITPTAEGSVRTAVASGQVKFCGSLQVKVDNDTLYGRVTIADMEIVVDQEELKHWEEDAKNLVTTIVQSYVNDFLLKGVALQLPMGARVEEAQVKFAPGTCQAQGSFLFKGIEKRKK